MNITSFKLTALSFLITLGIVIPWAFSAEFILEEHYTNSIGVCIVIFGTFLIYKPIKAFLIWKSNIDKNAEPSGPDNPAERGI